jgi:hypothetical protein
LPPLDSHDNPSQSGKYAAYKMRALFFNATARTVDGLSGAVHQKNPIFKLPNEKLRNHLDDITLTNVTADSFAFTTTQEILKIGRYGILVEMASDDSPETRPYWIGYVAEAIVSWNTDRIDGAEVLTRVVLKEMISVPSSDVFVDDLIEQYRVLKLADGVYTQELWRRSNSSDSEKGGSFKPWSEDGEETVVIPKRRGTKLDFIPFVFISPTSITPGVDKPPLIDLVDVNLSHYRTMADLEHGRHFTALPTPWVSGIADPQTTKLSIGSGKAWILSSDGRAGMLEFTGQGLGALEAADEQKRKMMATLGARLLEEQPRQAETMGAVGMRHSGEHATLRSVAMSIERGITQALKWHVWWMTPSVATSKEVEATAKLNKEFFTTKMSSADLKNWVFALQSDAVTYATFYAALEEGDLTRDGISWEEELKQIEDAGGSPNSGPVAVMLPPDNARD